MAFNDLRIGSGAGVPQPKATGAVAKAAGTGFDQILTESIGGVGAQMREADALSEGLMSGQHSNIHETMIAMEKSSISFRMLTKVQAKVVDAYREIMRLQL